MREEPLALTAEERELLSLELAALIPALEGERRQLYQALAQAVEDGQVPPSLLPPLEGLLDLALETGRARILYRAEGERVLTDLFRRTPKGGELARLLEEVNKALSSLEGRTLKRVQVAMRTLGHFTIALEVEGAGVTLAVRPQGVTVESISVG